MKTVPKQIIVQLLKQETCWYWILTLLDTLSFDVATLTVHLSTFKCTLITVYILIGYWWIALRCQPAHWLIDWNLRDNLAWKVCIVNWLQIADEMRWWSSWLGLHGIFLWIGKGTRIKCNAALNAHCILPTKTKNELWADGRADWIGGA